MRLSGSFLIALTLGLGGCADGVLRDALTGVYFVKLDSEPAKVAGVAVGIAEAFNLELLHVYDSASEGMSVRLPHLLVPELENAREIEYIIEDGEERRLPDEETPVDDDISSDPSVVVGPTEVPESLERIGAPYLGPIDLSGIHVAVIDTGVDAAHPDLNVVGEYDIVAQSGSGRAAPGYDPNGHGTHVAGTIGAFADSDGVVGVAPGVPIHAIRVLNEDGSGYWSDIVAGLEYVLEHPEIRVVNLSLGGPAMRGPDPMRDAIARLEDAGVVVVIAAGNETQDTDNVAPAGYDLGVVVSAYDSAGGDNGWAWFSNFGDAVDIAAPGVAIASTWPDAQYADLDGTSMATPAVAGAVAAYLALRPDATPAEVRSALVETAEEGVRGQGNEHPEPLLDAEALFASVGG
jgi:subtilisin family serine protease